MLEPIALIIIIGQGRMLVRGCGKIEEFLYMSIFGKGQVDGVVKAKALNRKIIAKPPPGVILLVNNGFLAFCLEMITSGYTGNPSTEDSNRHDGAAPLVPWPVFIVVVIVIVVVIEKADWNYLQFRIGVHSRSRAPLR